MSVKVKKAGRFGTKIVAVFLFVFLVMFNVQIGMHDGESGDISLWGLTLSLFTPSFAATGGGYCEVAVCKAIYCIGSCGSYYSCDVLWDSYIPCYDWIGCC